MCIGIWTLDHPEYALILCTNRDEFLDRPTLDAHWHNFEHIVDSPSRSGQEHTTSSKEGSILSGRDIKAGGSWFGINRAGRIALLTNITEAPTTLSSSRGFLVSSFLTSNSAHPLEEELGGIVDPNGKFAGFNLTLFAPQRTPVSNAKSNETHMSYASMLVTNHGAGGILTSRPLSSAERACGAVSNGIDGKGGEEWEKCRIGRSSLEGVLMQEKGSGNTEEELIQRLFGVLSHRAPAPIIHRTQLRTTVLVEPIPISGDSKSGWGGELKNNLPSNPNPPSSPEVDKLRHYGTRLSTVLLVRRNGDVLFVERDIWKLEDGELKKAQGDSAERRMRFRIPVIGLEGR